MWIQGKTPILTDQRAAPGLSFGMKLSLFHPALDSLGGAEVLAATQALYFHNQGVEVSLTTFAYDSHRWEERLGGVPVRHVPKRSVADLLHGFGALGKIKGRGNRAKAALQDADAVVAFNFPCNAMLGAADIPGRKFWQCLEPPRGLYMKEANPFLTEGVARGGVEADAVQGFATKLAVFEANILRASSLQKRRQYDLEQTAHIHEIFAISEFSRDNARKIYGRCNEEVVYPMVRFPAGGRTRAGLDRTGLKVLVHSRLEIFKNIDTVLKGFSQFLAQFPGAQIHVVGEGAHRPRLEALAGELGLGAAARFHGYLPDAELRAVYEVCDVFALLTLDEPFGMVYPEAAAKGLLLVGPDHGGPFEIMEGGALGWVCEAFSAEALAETFAQIWALDDAEVDRRRALADRACRERFSTERIGEQLLRIVKA